MSEHFLQLGKPDYTGRPRVYGVSTWDMPDGDCLRREMRRSTLLSSPAAIKRWAKRYSVSQDEADGAVKHITLCTR